MTWTEERIADLRKLWDEGLSTGEIGKVLGVSKNAVVGKAHRLGLPGRPSPIKRDGVKKKASAPKKRKVAAKAPTSGAAPVQPKPQAVKSKGKNSTNVLGLRTSSCRWPIGDPKDPDFHFCGEPAEPGRPYCAEHAAIAYVQVKSRKEDNG